MPKKSPIAVLLCKRLHQTLSKHRTISVLGERQRRDFTLKVYHNVSSLILIFENIIINGKCVRILNQNFLSIRSVSCSRVFSIFLSLVVVQPKMKFHLLWLLPERIPARMSSSSSSSCRNLLNEPRMQFFLFSLFSRLSFSTSGFRNVRVPFLL